MTERIYYREPGRTEFEAVIRSVHETGDRFHTLLDQSAFYPTSGGQLFDTGTINGVPVTDVIETPEGEVAHVSERAVGQAGERAVGRVDPYRRRMHRQQHTAQHILSQVFVGLFGYPTVSVHLGEEYGAVELRAEGVSPDQVRAVEERVVEAIFADHPIEILFLEREEAFKLPLRRVPTREGTIRIIKIAGFDYSACGGTHCDSTAQVGLFHITGVEKMRGNPLVVFLAGEQARADYAARYEVTRQLSQLLTCHFADVPESLQKIESEQRELKAEISRLQKELLPSQAREIAAKAQMIGSRGLVVTAVGLSDARLAGALAAAVAERIQGLAALLFDGRLVVAVAPAAGLHAGNVLKDLAASSGLRGGGNAALAQAGGAFPDQLDRYRSMLERLLRES